MGPFDCCEPKARPRRQPAPADNNKKRDQSAKPTTGARDDDVDELVRDILKDPSINISIIPDSVEQLIYKSTIQLTLNAFYSIFQNLEGTKFMAHQIHLNIDRGNDDDTDDDDDDDYTIHRGNTASASRSFLYTESVKNPSPNVDDKVLEDVAERLLANKAINQRFLPDRLEHLLYTNCLKVVFRILDILASSLRVTVCGHDIGLFLKPAAWQEILVRGNASSLASSPLSEIDQDKLRQFARQEAGITEELGFWDSIFVPKEFVAQLHASLYAMILGIVDDMLANTKIEIMSDKISLDIVPSVNEDEAQDSDRTKAPLSSNENGKGEPRAERRTNNSGISNIGQEEQRAVEERKTVCSKFQSVGFENERKIILHRFRDMTPKERLILASDLQVAGYI